MIGSVVELAAQAMNAVLAPLAILWAFLWPARQSLLTVVLILFWVHGTFERDEDPNFF